ncbi:MAG: hypothetical protein OXF88_02835 [Rhodobacteraceae bacterium]|nr:hypothetical protein [Paracoccaceae bacterium]MCY4139120.1 hypothetical protein [Paracoccaceae bacterium]
MRINIDWLEHDYRCRIHRELGVTPLERLTQSDNAARDCPDSAALRSAFRLFRLFFPRIGWKCRKSGDSGVHGRAQARARNSALFIGCSTQ